MDAPEVLLVPDLDRRSAPGKCLRRIIAEPRCRRLLRLKRPDIEDIAARSINLALVHRHNHEPPNCILAHRRIFENGPAISPQSAFCGATVPLGH